MCVLRETLGRLKCTDSMTQIFGFGDSVVEGSAVFPVQAKKGPCTCFMDVINAYKETTQRVTLGNPTNFAPLVKKAIEIVKETKQYHLLVTITDGQVVGSKETADAFVEASNYPLSITVVGVGDGLWKLMMEYDDHLPDRHFDNFQFVDFHKVKSMVESQKIQL